MINQQLWFINGGKGIACLTQRVIQIILFFYNLVALQIITGLNAKRGTQLRIIRCAAQIAQINRGIGITFAGNNIEPHGWRFRGRILPGLNRPDRTDNLPVVIAVNAQQIVQQFLILLRPRGKLSHGGIGIVQIFNS